MLLCFNLPISPWDHISEIVLITKESNIGELESLISKFVLTLMIGRQKMSLPDAAGSLDPANFFFLRSRIGHSNMFLKGTLVEVDLIIFLVFFGVQILNLHVQTSR